MTLKSGEYLGFFNKWQQPSCFYLWCGLWPGEAVGTSCSTEGFPLPVPQTGTKLRIEPIAYSESTLSKKWQLSFGKPWKHNSTEREEIWITQESCLIFNLLSQQHSETHTSYWENSHKHSHYFCKGRICCIAKCLRSQLEQLCVLGSYMWHFLFSLKCNKFGEKGAASHWVLRPQILPCSTHPSSPTNVT